MVGDLRTLHVDERIDTRRAVLEEIERTQPEILSPEFRTLRKKFQDLRRDHPNEYVAIHGTKVVGVWASYEKADKEVFRLMPNQSVTITRLDEHGDLPAAVAVDCLGEILRRDETP